LYNKLVRDLVPGTLRAGGHEVSTRTLVGRELLEAFGEIDEEAAEYDTALDDEQAAVELADLLEGSWPSPNDAV